MYTIKGHYNNELKTKGSLFKVFTFEIENLDSMKEKLSKLENQFYDASHICYGYRLCDLSNLDLFFNPNIIEFSTDDGEPSGTAGKPILNVLRKNEIVNRVIFVVRYFGGNKLGIPGLIEAYKNSAKLVLKSLEYKKWIMLKTLTLTLSYNYHEIIKNIIYKYDGNIINSDFSDDVLLKIEFPYKDILELKKILIEKTHGKIKIDEV